MKKLIPALALLLVSAVMLGTSSFAWFSMNTTVTAGTMEVKAVANANLYIAKGASIAVDGITGVAVEDLNVTKNALKPADMSDSGGTVTVREALTYTVDPTVDSAGTGATWDTIGTITQTTATGGHATKSLDNYVASAYVSIARKQTVAATYDLTPSCTVTIEAAKSSNLNKCLRAGIIINGAFYESNDPNVATGTITFTFSTISGLADNTAYSVALLLWYEGEDTDCFVNNATVLTANTAAWSFSAVDHVNP